MQASGKLAIDKDRVVDDLAERTEITLHVEMSPEEATLYEVLRQRAVEELEAARKEDPDMGEGARRVQVLAHLTRLRLACCNPRLVIDRPGATPRPTTSTKASSPLSALTSPGASCSVATSMLPSCSSAAPRTP